LDERRLWIAAGAAFVVAAALVALLTEGRTFAWFVVASALVVAFAWSKARMSR
jgi:hypothetical protein